MIGRQTTPDRQSPVPLYYQIYRILRREIETGGSRAGETLPTEAELQRIFDVSRATVRQAISELVAGDLLRRAGDLHAAAAAGGRQTSLENYRPSEGTR